ncbi:MAG: hypothetical protein IPK20_22005 [Betaproteobacteria bacterium]|nr:hypothetical protein [Betaproteobacteria bacterium]
MPGVGAGRLFTPPLGSRTIVRGTAGRLAAGTCPCPLPWAGATIFPWQSKAFLQPAFFPTVVATSFAVDALEGCATGWQQTSVAAGRFVARHLHRHQDADGICFNYSPGDRTRVSTPRCSGPACWLRPLRTSMRTRRTPGATTRAAAWPG